MEKEKHTPGPWIITPTLNETAVAMPHTTIGIAPYRVCSINPRISKGDAEANSLLIAAAPELLEALKAMRTYQTRKERALAIGLADEAIAKAEGK